MDDVRRIFPDDNNGSRIILTTRLQDVAAYADPSSPFHEMHFMDMDQSWNLLRQKVFKQETCPPELENTGKMIAGSCKGLPLAIIVIAGLLSTVSQTQASWEDIAKKVNSAVTANGEEFAKILSLSYSHLPHHLRPCFLYMGAFPEDHEIRVAKLVKLWVAEGFMKPSASKSFEERAEEYLEDLVKRSLVLVTRRKCNGKIKSCSVHDLIAEDTGCSEANSDVFPAQVLELFHLRYLAFTYGYKAEIWRMAQLRHVVSFMLDPLPSPCARSFALENLQTLARVANFKCAKRIGQIFPSLKKLGLIYNRDRVFWQVYHLHILVHLHQLEKLKICIRSSYWGGHPLWEKLAFPTTLKKLTLSGCVLSQQDMATIGSLPNLHVLKLRRCSFRGGKWETTEGEFPQLNFLHIESENLKHWVTESCHFPNLEHMVLHDCGELGEIPDVIGEIPTLELIEVSSWPKSLLDSALRIKEEQQESGNDFLQVWYAH
ncbi:UNVERIFIED_CONTAM: putative late blight resistance proteinR1A-4 [Sesamum latifolium]|uniref:Late blight resistance proteinR1A-4 n=1 Tax=Sesamum latifolium TaxID=2727402 RepID=A0AAW2TCZ2_9LAMI